MRTAQQNQFLDGIGFHKLKKRMKFGLWLGALGLTTTAIAVPLSSSHYQNQVNVSYTPLRTNAHSETVNYDEVEALLNSQSSDGLASVSLQSAVQSLSTTQEEKPELSPHELAAVKEKQSEIFNFFKSNKYTLEEIDHYLSTNYPTEYENSYLELNQANNKLDNASLAMKKQSLSASLQLSTLVSFNKLDDLYNRLLSTKATFIGISVAAGIAASAFFALSPLTFGATTPWGVACLSATVLASSAVIVLDNAIAKYEGKSELEKLGNNIHAAASLVSTVYSILTAGFTPIVSAASLLSWAFPAILTLVATIGTILAIIGQLR